MATEQLEKSKLPASHKRALKRLVAVRSNKDAQQPDVVARSMRKARQTQVIAATRSLAPILGTPTTRGAMGLASMSDDEWERLINGKIEP
jgi:hypothetical protein